MAHTFKDRPLPSGPVSNPDDRPLNPPNVAATYESHPRHVSNPDDRPLNPPNTATTFEPRSRPVVNPDDRPLNPPDSFYTSADNNRRSVQNPDDRLLNPPEGYFNASASTKPMPTHPRQILNPDDKLLPLPEAGSLSEERDASRVRKASGSASRKQEPVAAAAVNESKVHKIGEKVKDLGHAIEHKGEEIVKDIRNDKHKWVHFGIVAVVVGLAVSVFRK